MTEEEFQMFLEIDGESLEQAWNLKANEKWWANIRQIKESLRRDRPCTPATYQYTKKPQQAYKKRGIAPPIQLPN